MLVVSRKPDDAVTFPALGITVRVLRTNHKTARIGIEAPSHIRILRHELLDGSTEETFDVDSFSGMPTESLEVLHQRRNQLNSLNLGLMLYRKQMEVGRTSDAAVTFDRVIKQLRMLEEETCVRQRTRPADHEPEPKRRSETLRLLIVEDDPEQRDFLASVLELQGCEVKSVPSGNAAMSHLESNQWPDFILLDMRMENGDGASTVRKLRKLEKNKEVGIVAISGADPSHTGVVEGAGGVDRWFPKPINPNRLVEYMRLGLGDHTPSPVM